MPSTSRELPRGFVTAWMVTILVVTTLPYLWLRARSGTWAGEGATFLWLLPPYPDDGLAYLAWIRQAEAGDWLFRVKYTQIEHAPALFHPLFLIVGRVASATGMSAGFALFLLRFPALLACLHALRRLVGGFGFGRGTQMTALLLAGFASGLGAFIGWDRLRSADLWIPELNTLWSLTWNPIFAAALALMLYALDAVFREIRARPAQPRSWPFLIAGACTGALAFIHAYDVVIVGAVVGVVTLLACRTSAWRPLVVYGLLAGPPALLQWNIARTHPVLSDHSAGGEMLSPSPLALLTGLGLPLLLAAPGAVIATRRHRREASPTPLPLIIWTVVSFALAWAPVWYQRKLLMGVQIPIAVLAAIGLVTLAQRLAGGRRIVSVGVIATGVLLTLPTHLVNVQRMNEQVVADPYAYFTPEPLGEALAWLDDNTDRRDVVLAHPSIARTIPATSGNTVTLGHWAQSVDRESHLAWLREVFAPNSPLTDTERRERLAASRIAWIVVDARMLREWMGGQPPTWLEPISTIVYRGSAATILAIEREASQRSAGK